MKLYTIWNGELCGMAVRQDGDNYVSTESTEWGSIGSRWYNDDRYNTDPMVVIKYSIGAHRKAMNSNLKEIARLHRQIVKLEEIKQTYDAT